MALTISIAPWHEFFVLVGTAAATLIGLMFVAVSITAGYMTEELRPGLRTFLSPTIFHLAAVLMVCLASLLPTGDTVVGAIVLTLGVFGCAYATRVLLHIEGFVRDPDSNIDGEDRFFYGIAPSLAQMLVLAGGALVLARFAGGPWILACALVALLLLCIRNAWDITVWAVIRSPNL